MEVATAETERTDRRASGLIAGAHPRAGLGVDVEGCLVQPERRVRAVHLRRAGERRMLQCQNRLDQPGGSGCRFGVAYLGLDRAECDARRVVGEHGFESGELGDVTGFGRGAMRLEQFHRRRCVTGVLVSETECLGLTLRTWCVDAGCPPVRGASDAPDDRMDLVAVPLGIAEALEGEHADALADDRSVGGIGKRSAVTALRERGSLGKAHEHHDVVERVDAAGEHQVRFVEVQPVQ